MHERRDRTGSELPGEPDHDVNEDAAEGVEHGQCAVFRQFLAHLWSDEFYPAHLGARQYLQYARTQVSVTRRRALRQADEDIAW